jgi:hypothetical protein
MNLKLILVILITVFCTGRTVSQKIYFTEKEYKNWEIITNNKNTPVKKLFQFDDRVLHVTNASLGYIRTKKVYADYTLEVDWRWTQTLANSGILVHIQKNDTVWPKCYQIQQKAGFAGDIICMNGLWVNECTDTVKFTIPKFQSSNEKPLGEWNHVKIISKKSTLTVYVNGLLQNKVTGLTVGKGFIGFQAEGNPLEFKNLKIKR